MDTKGELFIWDVTAILLVSVCPCFGRLDTKRKVITKLNTDISSFGISLLQEVDAKGVIHRGFDSDFHSYNTYIFQPV